MKHQLLFAAKFVTLAGVYLFTRSRTPVNKLRTPEKSLAVLFILENLKRILVQNANLIRDAENQVGILRNDILLFKAFLRDSAKRRNKDENLEEYVRQIQKVVSEAEEVIGVFSKMAAENGSRNFFQRAFSGSMELISVAKEVRAMRIKVKKVYDKSRVFSAGRKV